MEILLFDSLLLVSHFFDRWSFQMWQCGWFNIFDWIRSHLKPPFSETLFGVIRKYLTSSKNSWCYNAKGTVHNISEHAKHYIALSLYLHRIVSIYVKLFVEKLNESYTGSSTKSSWTMYCLLEHPIIGHLTKIMKRKLEFVSQANDFTYTLTVDWLLMNRWHSDNRKHDCNVCFELVESTVLSLLDRQHGFVQLFPCR